MADDCGCGTGTVIYISGTPGPAGPMGPQGPPGAGVSYPIAASNISVTNLGFSNLQQVLDFLLYIPLTITSFAVRTPTHLIGGSLSAVTFDWVLSGSFTVGTISGPNLVGATMVASPTSSALSGVLTPITVGTTYTYTMNVTDGTDSPTANTVVIFLNNVYYGDAVVPGSIDSTFVNTLGSTTQASLVKTVISNAAGSQYAWFANRVALGLATFTVGGFPGGFNSPTTVSVTNSSGFTENYYVYRSTNPAIGPVTYVTS